MPDPEVKQKIIDDIAARLCESAGGHPVCQFGRRTAFKIYERCVAAERARCAAIARDYAATADKHRMPSFEAAGNFIAKAIERGDE